MIPIGVCASVPEFLIEVMEGRRIFDGLPCPGDQIIAAVAVKVPEYPGEDDREDHALGRHRSQPQEPTGSSHACEESGHVTE